MAPVEKNSSVKDRSKPYGEAKVLDTVDRFADSDAYRIARGGSVTT